MSTRDSSVQVLHIGRSRLADLGFLVGLEGSDLLPGQRAPKVQDSVLAQRTQEITVERKIGLSKERAFSIQCQHILPACDVPESDGLLVIAADGQPGSVGRKGHGMSA